MITQKQNPTMMTYFCGGAACNIGYSFHHSIAGSSNEPGFANMKVVYIDTTESNFPKGFEADFYQIEGDGADKIDGSGKVRDTNYPAIAKAMPDILHRHKYEDINVVMHSASGGSGAVIANVLVSELLAQGKAVVVIMIGSTTCEQEIRNTIKTIYSYQGISQSSGRPVVATYLENSETSTMSHNDSLARITVLLLASVWSGQNHGLDSKDLDNFLNYDRVSKYPAALTGLKIYSGKEHAKVEKGQAVSSVVSLIREGEDANPGMVVGYHSFGIISAAASDAIEMPSPIHLHTVQGYYTDVVARLQAKLTAAEEMYRVNPVNSLNISGLAVESNGICL